MLGQSFDDVLLAARAGGGWAYTRLYEDLAGVVTGYLRQQGAREPDDVASETFLDVFRGITTFEGDEAGFRSWVFTIAHRRLVDERRRWDRRPTTTSIEATTPAVGRTAPADEAALAEADAVALRQWLEVLTSAQRDVVLLRVVAGLSVSESAAVLDRSEDGVRQLQRRGLRALEAELQTDQPSPPWG